MMYPYVSFVIPYALYLPDSIYPVKFKAAEVVHVRTSFLPSGPQPDGVHISGPNIELLNDVFGYAGKTKLEFLFISRPMTQPYLSVKEEQRLLQDALSVCNRVIDVYRAYDRNSLGLYSFHVIRLAEHDLSMKVCGLADENMNVEPESKVVKPLRNTVAVGPDAVRRSEDIISEIRDTLLIGNPIPLETLLLRSAQNHLWRSEYWFVPLEMTTAFEIVVTNILRNTMELLNESHGIPGRFFDRLVWTQKYINKARERKGLTKIKLLDDRCSGWRNFKACPELTTWKKGCYELRNRVVHEAYLDVTKAEAENAMHVTFQAINHMLRLFP